MFNMESQTSKPLTKDETIALLKLVEESNILLKNKKTNATSNKLKVQEWIRIAQTFNKKVGTCERTWRQLRLKWENLKKNARRRNASIQINKMDGGTPHMKPDEVLDKVYSMLNSPINDYKDKFGGDSQLINDDASNCSNPDSFLKNHAILPLQDIEVINIIPEDVESGKEERREGIQRKYRVNESRVARDKAIQNYYEAKRKIIEELFHLEKEKLKLEIEKLKNNS